MKINVYFKNYLICQLVLEGVVNMDMPGYEENDSGLKHSSSVHLSYFILLSKV